MSTAANKLTAARGAAGLPPEAALELVVALSTDPDEMVRSEARKTLQAWPPDTLQPLLKRRATSPDVLEYFLRTDNLRIELLPTVLGNRSTPQEARKSVFIGSADECLETIDRYGKVGVTHFIFSMTPPYMEEGIQAFAEEVIPRVRA